MFGFEVAVTCLALNVYKEARGEPVRGQHAVALVTLNRARITALNKDVCQIVFEPYQFSWTTTDSVNGVLISGKRPNRNSDEWKRAEQSALEALYMEDFTNGATHYHATTVKPQWARNFEFVGQWGNHKFYKGDYGNQYSAKGPDRGTGNTACSGTDCSGSNGTERNSASGKGDSSAEPEPKRSWWFRFMRHVRNGYRGKATGTVVD